MLASALRNAIRTIPDFPKSGILFRDISPILESGELFQLTVDLLAAKCAGLSPVKIVGLDARGFIFGGALAYKLGLGFVPVRKKGKLPSGTISQSYELEYGSAEFEIHSDSIASGESVIIVDDLLATGGTSGAAIQLVKQLGASVLKALFVIELIGLGGRERLGASGATEISSLMSFPA
jgi:adenine phosphoribosyltransferase